MFSQAADGVQKRPACGICENRNPPPENTAQDEGSKKGEPAADVEQAEPEKSKLPEDLQKLLDDPDVPDKIKKAIRAAADADADIEVIRVKGKKG